jgi:hypothetical protein
VRQGHKGLRGLRDLRDLRDLRGLLEEPTLAVLRIWIATQIASMAP